MTQQNKTDNVLVSREKWEEMLDVLYHQHWSSDGYEHKEILAMPDFIESERDRDIIATAACTLCLDRSLTLHDTIEAAINALQYRKEGGK